LFDDGLLQILINGQGVVFVEASLDGLPWIICQTSGTAPLSVPNSARSNPPRPDPIRRCVPAAHPSDIRAECRRQIASLLIGQRPPFCGHKSNHGVLIQKVVRLRRSL